MGSHSPPEEQYGAMNLVLATDVLRKFALAKTGYQNPTLVGAVGENHKMRAARMRASHA